MPHTSQPFTIFHSMVRKFLLCFHDFSVWNYQKVAPILEELKDLAGRPFSVLVIPDTEKAPSDMVKGFREMLQKLKADGFELALHGYKHKVAGAGNGEEFGEALQKAEDDGFDHSRVNVVNR